MSFFIHVSLDENECAKQYPDAAEDKESVSQCHDSIIFCQDRFE